MKNACPINAGALNGRRIVQIAWSVGNGKSMVEIPYTKKLHPLNLVASYDIWPGKERAYILVSALPKFVTY